MRLRATPRFRLPISDAQVSIPFGAIKRPVTDSMRESVKEFQFLLVRLRENHSGTFESFVAVSIPFGAIKSIFTARISKYPVLFQFLLVRLRDCAKHRFFGSSQVSIPFGAIKRQ